MHLYGDDFNPVHAWNAVNILNSNGLFQHGKVINVVEYGLLIDFGWPEQKSQFVAYERIFDCSEYATGCRKEWFCDRDRPCPVKSSVQALMRVGRDRSWTWMPAKLLGDYSSVLHYGFVEVELAGVMTRELLPLDQIRIPPMEGDLTRMEIEEGSFVTRSCSLPKDWSSSASPRVLYGLLGRQIGRQYSAYPVCAVGGTLVYLQRRNMSPVQTRILELWLKTTTSQIAYYVRSGQEEWLCRHDLVRKPTEQRSDDLGPRGLSLPMELVVEIFQCSDTVTRTRCRRVCTQWKSLLGTEVCFRDTIASFSQSNISPSSAFSWSPLYAIVCCLLKNNSERMVIMDIDDCYGCDAVLLISRICHGLGKRIPKLIFYNCGFGVGTVSIRKLIQNLTDPVNGWDELVLQKCTILDVNVQARIQHISLTLRSGDEKRQQALLWDAVKNSLNGMDMPCVQQWIEGVEDSANNLDWYSIILYA